MHNNNPNNKRPVVNSSHRFGLTDYLIEDYFADKTVNLDLSTNRLQSLDLGLSSTLSVSSELQSPFVAFFPSLSTATKETATATTSAKMPTENELLEQLMTNGSELPSPEIGLAASTYLETYEDTNEDQELKDILQNSVAPARQDNAPVNLSKVEIAERIKNNELEIDRILKLREQPGNNTIVLSLLHKKQIEVLESEILQLTKSRPKTPPMAIKQIKVASVTCNTVTQQSLAMSLPSFLRSQTNAFKLSSSLDSHDSKGSLEFGVPKGSKGRRGSAKVVSIASPGRESLFLFSSQANTPLTTPILKAVEATSYDSATQFLMT